MRVLMIITILAFVSQIAIGQEIIKGRVVTQEGKPLANVNIEGLSNKWYSDAEGNFAIATHARDTLRFTRIGFQERLIPFTQLRSNPVISLLSVPQSLEAVDVVYTGFQKLTKQQVTGSVDVINESLLNRTSSPNILDRIEGLTPGIQFHKGEAAESDPYLIRGRSTITGIAAPLIVVDDFPYEGDLADINPEDVASVSILKDASAASLWGARAGNGVIIIKTKQGRSGRTKINVKTDVRFLHRPDLKKLQWISSADLIEFEKTRFEKGAYDGVFAGPYYTTPITPVVDLLFARRANPDREVAINAAIESLKHNDVRNDMSKYLYQTGKQKQLHVDVSGGSPNFDYWASISRFDKDEVLKGKGAGRTSMRINNTYRPIKNLDIVHTIQYIHNREHADANPGLSIYGNRPVYPYASLVDKTTGEPNSLYLYFPKQYLDTLGQGRLLDGTYNPVRDRDTEKNSTVSNNLTTGVALTWQPFPQLRLSGRYQFQQGKQEVSDEMSQGSYAVRSMINQFSYFKNGLLQRPVPLGGILDLNSSDYYAHQLRGQLDYSSTFFDNFGIDAIAGYEMRSREENHRQIRYYGYEAERMSISPVIDYVSSFTSLYNGGQIKINPVGGLSKMTDNFLSWYGNLVLSYHNILYFNGSVRKDEANLFGVQANAKGAPFWSTGLRWDITKSGLLPQFKNVSLRASYGVNGNVSRAASAATTIQYVSYSVTGLPAAILNSPPNKNLKWDKIATLSVGLDFSTANDRISGYVEYYTKNGKDLLAEAPVDPTKGMSVFFGNVAEMEGNGVEALLTLHHLKKRLNWSTTFNFSYGLNKVKKYLMPPSSSATPYLTGISIAPIEGRPLYSLHSYGWAGIDPTTGDPQGYLDGVISKDYRSIVNNTKIDEVVFHGSRHSPIYGSLRNDFSYRNISLSFNISYKFGGFFRTQSLRNNELMVGFNAHSDYSKRWQQTGDEHTNVPSIDWTNNPDRDTFYRYSAVLIAKSDNVRLEDMILSYRLSPEVLKLKWISDSRFFVNVQNINLVWLGNDRKVDPYFNNVPRTGASYTFGMNLMF